MPVTYPEDYYKGEYIIDIAKEMLEKDPKLPTYEDAENRCYEYAMNSILNGIKQDLHDFRVEHQCCFPRRASFMTELSKKRSMI